MLKSVENEGLHIISLLGVNIGMLSIPFIVFIVFIGVSTCGLDEAIHKPDHPSSTNLRRNNSWRHRRRRRVCSHGLRIDWRLIVLIRWEEVRADLAARRRHEDLVVSPSLVVRHVHVRSYASSAIPLSTGRSADCNDRLRTLYRIRLLARGNQLVRGQYTIRLRIVLQMSRGADTHVLFQVRCETLNQHVQIGALMLEHITGVLHCGLVSVRHARYRATTTRRNQ